MTKDQSNSRRGGGVPALRTVETEWVAIFVIATVRLWLSAARAVEAIGWSDYDDLWFIRRARSILEGRWLGDYDHLTLIKGQGYPLWIAFVSSLGIPLLFAQQSLYVLACLATTHALAPVVQSRPARVILFAVLVFNPMSYADDISTRITREGFYPALSMFVFAGLAGVLLRIDARRRDVILWSVAAGIAIAVFWHTREEGIWIAPLLVSVAIAMCTRWRRLLLVGAITVSIFAVAHTALAVANGLHYGVFATVEFKEESFLRAYGSLTHVHRRNPVPHVPVPKEVRERVYTVSPAFAELRPFLEGQLGADWAHVSKVQNREDIGWPFMWAFREAVANAGYYERGGAAVREYYGRVSREIETARLSGRLEAAPALATLRPPMLPGQIRSVLKTWILAFTRVFRFTDFTVTHRFSVGDSAPLREYDITHTRLAPRETGKPDLNSRDTLRLQILVRIGRAYQIAFLPVFALATVICAIRWRGNRLTLALIAGLLSAIAARVMILALIDVTSFSVFTGGYQAPSHALLLIAGGLIAHEALRAIGSVRSS